MEADTYCLNDKNVFHNSKREVSIMYVCQDQHVIQVTKPKDIYADSFFTICTGGCHHWAHMLHTYSLCPAH